MSFISNLFKNKKTTIPVRITSVTKLAAPEIQDDESIEAVTPGDWFTSKEHYLEFRAAFKKWINYGNWASSSHFILYAILRNRDWKDGWNCPKSPGKQIEHKYKKSSSFYIIKSGYQDGYLLKPFGGTITTAMLKALRENLDDIRGK